MFNVNLLSEAMATVPKKFMMANLVTMRIRQLMSGADPLVDPEDMKYVDIALKEISEGLIEPHKVEVTTSAELFQTEANIFQNASEEPPAEDAAPVEAEAEAGE
jgi:DNA-directed RNA polymerase omega subunit